jgi:hypothetical protein
MNSKLSFPPNVGHLIRDMKLWNTLCFERGLKRQVYLTLVNARPGRIGFDLEAPHICRAIVLISYGRGRLKSHICCGRERRCLVLKQDFMRPIRIDGSNGAGIEWKVVDILQNGLLLEINMPKVGTAVIQLAIREDGAKFDIFADRSIHIFPTQIVDSSNQHVFVLD